MASPSTNKYHSLCFEVSVNDGAPVLAGLAEASVLTAIATFVREHAELELGDLLPAMEKGTGGLHERSKKRRSRVTAFSVPTVIEPTRADSDRSRQLERLRSTTARRGV